MYTDESDSSFEDDMDYADSKCYTSTIIDNYEIDSQTNIDNLYPRFPQYWVKDEIVDNCYNCNSNFSWLLRKHHCRSCGRIFCNKCSNFYIELPRSYIKFPKPPKQYINKIKNKILKEKEIRDRVCLYCYDKINNLERLFKYVKVFELLAFDIKQLREIALVSKKWNYASNTLLMKFREIQYYPCGQLLTETEKNLLWINRRFMTGHSKWLCLLMKTINWSNKKVSDEISLYLSSKREHSCNNLMCNEHCRENFTIFDTIDLISNIIPNKIINSKLVNILSSLDTNELLIYLPIMVYYMKYEMDDNNFLSQFIIDKCVSSKSISFINNVYWALIINCEIYSYSKYNIILANLNERLSVDISADFLKQLHKSFTLVHVLNNIPKNSINKNIIEYLRYMAKNHYFFNDDIPLYLPIDSNIKCLDLDYDNVDIKNSATCPIKIPFKCTDKINKTEKTYSIIYKNEDLRIDMVIMNLINMIELILIRETGINFYIKKYRILPTSISGGIIQIVDQAETLYNISQKRKMTILNYIMEYNPSSKVEDLRDIFIKSCAAYCVITYLLGIGDRHLDNIMVTEKGEIFHIDYSYILGKEPKIISMPKIRITPEMLDAMGGENSQGFNKFKNLVSIIYKCLRKYYNLFINMMIILADISDKYDKEYIRDEIINRFLLGQTHIEAELEIETHISQSKSNHYGQNIIDFFHYHQKERTVNSIINYTNSISNNMYNIIWGENKE